MSKNRSALYVGLMVLAAAVAGYMVSRQLARTVPALTSGTALPSPRPVTKMALTDHLGQPFGTDRLAGAPSLVFFGFTHCPDVCPTTLAMLAQVQRDPALADLRILFVTVDPARDDLATLRHYIDAFGGGMIGLRGEEAELEPLLANIGAARLIEQRPGGDYFVDHSATLYYLDSRGALAAVFSPPFDLAQLRTDLATLVAGDR